MPFRIPTFNLTANIWHAPNAPPAAPNVVSPAQLRATGRQTSGQDATAFGWPPLWEVLLPKLTDVRDSYGLATINRIEIPAGSQRFYRVVLVDDVAKGFANEYRIALVAKLQAWPTPIP